MNLILTSILTKIIKQDAIHGKWLNTLSYLENCGARKIAACEHPTLVKEEMLKHAAEEFRHSHYLKRQIKKVSKQPFDNYSSLNILGGIKTLHYLNKLDLFVSNYLIKVAKLPKIEIKKIAYLLVTYAIELRAELLYPIYDKILRANQSKVFVKSIILEEKEHLNEMQKGLLAISSGIKHAKKVTTYESILFEKWLKAVNDELKDYN
jgi:hypothetical protein